MSGIKLLLILVIAVLIVVLFKYVQIKRQIRNLSKQMTDLTTGKSEKMLDISLVDKDIEQLAAVLNQYNEKQRQSIASIRKRRTRRPAGPASGVFLWGIFYAFQIPFRRGLEQSYCRPVNRLPEARCGGLFSGLTA